jgi:Tfp pilus assembly protein PilN
MKAVNLLPTDQRGSSSKTQAAVDSPNPGGSPFGAYVVLGVLAIAVAAMAANVLTTNSIKDRKAQLAKVTSEAQVTQARANSLQAFADFKVLAEQRVATVQGLAASRFDWERTLTDLSRALPSDVHLRTLSGTTNTQVGGGGNALRGAIQAPALEMSGCTTSQSGVARLMSRLRNVRGVTRVSLTKSDKDAGGVSVAALPSATGDTPASLCPKGTPPAFDLVVFFERAAVAASASPNVGAAQAAGATGTQQPGAAAAAPSGSTSTQTPPSTGTDATPANGGAVPTTPGPGSAAPTQGVSAP